MGGMGLWASALVAWSLLLLLLLLLPAAQGHCKLCFLGAASASDQQG
jgi:hypothetical protein